MAVSLVLSRLLHHKRKSALAKYVMLAAANHFCLCSDPSVYTSATGKILRIIETLKHRDWNCGFRGTSEERPKNNLVASTLQSIALRMTVKVLQGALVPLLNEKVDGAVDADALYVLMKLLQRLC